MLRHEQQSIRMALAAALHHSSGKVHAEYDALRGLKIATRAGEEGHEDKHDAPRRQKPPPPQAFFQLFDEEDADKGMRPASLAEPRGPQERVQLRTVEHIADVVPVVQILDIPVPQKVERLADFLVLLDTQRPVEQVIAVPKISNDSIQPRLVDCDLRRPQMAEQLVEVPTVLSYAFLQQQTAEQIIDIPVPRRRRGQGGLQDFLPEQSSFAFDGADHRIDSPVRGRSGHGGLQGSHPGQSSTSFSGAQHEVQGFRPGQSSTSFSGDQREVQGFRSRQSSTSFSGAQHEVQGQGSTAPRGADSVGHRPPLPPERVAERLARIDAQVSLDEEEEVMEDMDLDAQPSRFQGSFRPTRYCRHFFVGQCWMGSSCTFAHAHDELHPAFR